MVLHLHLSPAVFDYTDWTWLGNPHTCLYKTLQLTVHVRANENHEVKGTAWRAQRQNCGKAQIWPRLQKTFLLHLRFLHFSFGSQRRRSHFSLPVLPYFPCLLSSIVWSIERLSLHCSSNWEIMDLINWSLNAIDTIWRYLPIRNHDNRYFADWIRLCSGLSKNSENGNSCPKPHKAARMIEAVRRAVSIETETIIAIWILGEAHGFA